MSGSGADYPEEQCIEDFKYIFRNDLLRNKVALITGGGSGIGFTIAEVFMRHGCDTAILGRKVDRLKCSAATLEKATGRRCLPLGADVRKVKELLDAVDKTLGQFGKIDILINGAAGNFLCPASALSFNAFRTVIDIDTIGTFNVSKIVYEKYMMEHGGVIVNITATLCYRGQTLQMHAGAAKAAVDAMTKHLAVEWGPSGIRVVTIAPGPIGDTEGMRRLAKGKNREAAINSIPLKRLGTREDIANTTLYAVSDAASYVTGAIIVADGGSWMTSDNSYERLSSLKSNL